MKKGIAYAILGAIILSAIVAGFIYFLDVILGIAILIGLGVLFALIIIPIIVFLVSFIALFYYMAAKNPKIEPGNYTLGEVKGKEGG